MPRAFLVVLDSVGCGGAPDSDQFFNDGRPDTGANTLAHIAQACANGRAEEGRSGALALPNLDRLGLGAAVRLASGDETPGLETEPRGLWGAATEVSGCSARDSRSKLICNWLIRSNCPLFFSKALAKLGKRCASSPSPLR